MANGTVPRLRYIDVIPIEQEDEVLIYIRDPQDIAASPLVISPHEFFVISMFDGQHTYSDIKLAFAQKFGGLLLQDDFIENLAATLDAHYYLDTSNFRDYYKALRKEFAAASTRLSWHAGISYEADPDNLKRQLEGFYQHPEGAGMPGTNGTATLQEGESLEAIMVPHIDLRVGGPCYTHAFKYLFDHSEPDVVVILGVAHSGSDDFFTATRKDFETPLGTVKTDQAFLDSWIRNAGNIDFAENDWPHRSEHSIEFQLPFLQHGMTKNFSVVPILCGPMEYLIEDDGSLTKNREIHQMAALKQTIEEDPREIVVLLSVDMAHMGPKFGDPNPITNSSMKDIEKADHAMFDALSTLDKSEYIKLMKDDLLKRRVDACASVFSLLEMMDSGRGELLSYGQNFQPDTQSIVTYGSMGFVKSNR